MNQYLVVQWWRPNFVPVEEAIKCMTIWVRLSRLPMEFIDADLLWRSGGMSGNTLKVDPVTETQARGRFARLCVEIDISKPLLGSLFVNGRTIRVKYENMELICFNCGIYCQSKDTCRDGVVEQQNVVNAEKENVVHNGNQDNPYGPWLQVSYNKNGMRGPKGRSGIRYTGFGWNVDNDGLLEVVGCLVV
ncbi:hypothetical protein ACOSP7_013937 [Xanthoceras sorbifolium]